MKNMVKNNKGITIIALIITIILTLILAAITVRYGTSEIDKARLEDLKTTMLLIKGRAQIVIDKETFGESYDNEGMIQIENASGYNITDLQEVLQNLDQENLYIWEQIAMDNNGIDVEITYDEFYVIDYNEKEVYYSLGYTKDDITYYSLTQLQSL